MKLYDTLGITAHDRNLGGKKSRDINILMSGQTQAASCETSVFSIGSMFSGDSRADEQTDNWNVLSVWGSQHLAFCSHSNRVPASIWQYGLVEVWIHFLFCWLYNPLSHQTSGLPCQSSEGCPTVTGVSEWQQGRTLSSPEEGALQEEAQLECKFVKTFN